MEAIFDYIVVGAGSAGCVLARRLVDAGRSVLLLEAGPADSSKFAAMPGAFVKLLGTERTWVYETEPQTAAANRKMFVPQGRTTGGGSSVNAMVYIRGTAQDYDDWQHAGCAGWGWQDVLPVFKKAEAHQRLSNHWHGTDGLLPVGDTRYRHPLSLAFLQGAQEAGLAYNDDFNGEQQTGVGFYHTTIQNGRRASTAGAYLSSIKNNSKLKLVNNAHVMQVLIEGSKGQALAKGVDYRLDNGQTVRALAACEVVLTAGALATPKLLQISGVGDAALLQSIGVPVRAHLPGVGENFQDHLEVTLHGQCKDPISLWGEDQGLKALRHGLQWELTKTGLLTSNIVECGGFVDTAGTGRADIQFHVLPVMVGDIDRAPPDGHGISINPCFLRPYSRGSVKARSAHSLEPAKFDSASFQDERDVATLVRGLQWARRIVRMPSMQKVIRQELRPGPAQEIPETELAQYCRQYAKTVYHPVGTCKMGVDEKAVVDLELKVRGVANLRVCDASVMPTIVSGNTNAPTIMIAERCASFILGTA